MKRFYFNQSHEPMKYRTWILAVDNISEADFKWLKGFDIPIRIDQPEQEFDSLGGRTHKVYGRAMYTCDTTTDKQRDMLVLKYGNNAILLSEDIVMPGSISTCTLSGISW
jgi:hypothetical protein